MPINLWSFVTFGFLPDRSFQQSPSFFLREFFLPFARVVVNLFDIRRLTDENSGTNLESFKDGGFVGAQQSARNFTLAGSIVVSATINVTIELTLG